MEVRQERVHAPEGEARRDEEVRAALERPAAGERLEHARRRRAHGEDPVGRLDPPPGRLLDPVALAVDRVLLDRLGRERPERVEADVQRDRLVVEAREELGCEVEPRGRRRGRAGIARVDRLVALRVGRRLVHVRRQRQLPVGLAGELHDPPPPPSGSTSSTEEAEPRPRSRSPARSRREGRASASQTLVPESLDEEHLDRAARLPAKREARGDDARVVDDRQVPRELLGQLGERPLPDVAGAAVVDEQPRRVAPLRRPLGDQLGRQRVVEVS